MNHVQCTFSGSYTITDGLQPIAHADVVHALRAQAVETVSRDPFDLYVTLPGQFGSLNFDTSQLQGAPYVNVPDVENHFATNYDVVLVRQSEMSQLRTAAQMATNAASLTRQIVELMYTTSPQPASDNQQVIMRDCLAVLNQLQHPQCQLAVAQQTMTSLLMKRDLMMRANLHPNENLDLMACVDASPHPLHHPHDTELLERKVSS